jgi:hypothetical protein
MNPRATLVLLAATILVVLAVIWLRRTTPPTADAAEHRRYAAVFEADRVNEVDLTRGGEVISIRREAGEWRLTAPVADRASADVVERLILAARLLDVRDRQPVEDPAAVTESGLAAPRLRLDLRGPEGDVRLDLGANTALPGEIFARVGGQRAILRVPDSIVELATAPVAGFRDPRLTTLVADDIEKFTVRRADGEMTVRRERGRWLIEKPVGAPADPRAMREFLEPLLGLRITAFPQDANPAQPAGTLPGETAAISLTPRGGGDALEFKVFRHGAATNESVPATLAARGGALEVDPAALRLFEVSPESLRDRSLGEVDPDTVDRIRVESGGRVMEIRREGDGWKDAAGGAADATQVTALIEAFNAARVVSFRTAASPAETGLGQPSRKIAFSSWLSENTPEETAGGHLLAGAELGAPAPDGAIYARAAGRDETVTIPPELAQKIDAMSGNAATTP